MFGTPEREDLIERLRDWLVQTDEDLEHPDTHKFERSLADGTDDPLPPRLVGIFQVVEGFTALRHDLKLHTKTARQFCEEVRAAVDRLDAATHELREAESAADQRADEAVRPFVEELMDIEELVSSALQSAGDALRVAHRNLTVQLETEINAEFERLPRWRKPLVAPWHRKVRTIVGGPVEENPSNRAVIDGLTMVRSRLHKSLESVGIERINCLGMKYDPESMRAVEVLDEKGREAETVVAELRPGYRYRGMVFRSAEVCVVRPPETSSQSQSMETE